MLKTLLSPFADKSYALLRIVSGGLLTFAGMQKTFGLLWPASHPRPALASQVGIGGVIELVAGAAITIGLFTRCAAFICSGMMAVAYWQFHVFMSQVPGFQKFIPGINQGIPAVLLCFIYLHIACRGAGPWSVDAAREKKAAS